MTEMIIWGLGFVCGWLSFFAGQYISQVFDYGN